jgi:hypothetical protein
VGAVVAGSAIITAVIVCHNLVQENELPVKSVAFGLSADQHFVRSVTAELGPVVPDLLKTRPERATGCLFSIF